MDFRVDINEGAAFAPMRIEQLAAHYLNNEVSDSRCSWQAKVPPLGGTKLSCTLSRDRSRPILPTGWLRPKNSGRQARRLKPREFQASRSAAAPPCQ